MCTAPRTRYNPTGQSESRWVQGVLDNYHRDLPNGGPPRWRTRNEKGVAMERKSMPDFVSTVIRARKRFHAELRKLAGCEFACVAVEASLRDVLESSYDTGAHPNAVIGAAISICVDWGIPVYFCGDRQTARRFTEDYLERCWRASNERVLG